MTAEDALAVAIHQNRHRISEPGLTVEPCGPCRNEALALSRSMPSGWLVVEVEAWRRESSTKAAGDKRYQAGLTDGARAERARVRGAIVPLLAD